MAITLLISTSALLFLLQLRTCSCNSNIKSRYFNGAVLARENHQQVEGKSIQSLIVPSSISCAQACLSHSQCASTNYKVLSQDHGLCQMKSDIIDKSEELVYNARFQFSRYFRAPEDCQLVPCLNGGTCTYDVTVGRFVCRCDLFWMGKSCEVKAAPEFNFTTLGATGRRGPQSSRDYKGTTLEDTVVMNSGVQEWTVPVSGLYRVLVGGAKGGEGFLNKSGGEGAVVMGAIHLLRGTKLKILVGQQGSTSGDGHPGSGGGGTFVVWSTNDSLIAVAGGGGGGCEKDGDEGEDEESGSVNGGTSGVGGKVCGSTTTKHAGAGGGFLGNGGSHSSTCAWYNDSFGGQSYKNGGLGGKAASVLGNQFDGGFGGGGASGTRAPGGGGGYSGGGSTYDSCKGGGGGSVVPDGTWKKKEGGNNGDGYVTFQFLR